jgi:hypothetical protein
MVVDTTIRIDGKRRLATTTDGIQQSENWKRAGAECPRANESRETTPKRRAHTQLASIS